MKITNFAKRFPTINLFITVIAIVWIWRGAWHLADSYIFPDYKLISDILPLLFGFWYLWANDHKWSELGHH